MLRHLTTLNNKILSVFLTIVSPHFGILFGFLKTKKLSTCIPTSNITMP